MTVQPTWPDHLMDLDEWSALPEEPDRRFELAEGVLQVSPRAVMRHQQLIMLLAYQLHDAGAGRWQAAPEFEVVVDDGPAATVRVPDVVVAPSDVVGQTPRLAGRDTLAVVEILSPGSRRLDRILKLAEYAEAGVPTYLLVEPGPPVSLTEFVLVDGAYERRAEHTGTADLALGVTLDLAALDG